MFLGVVCGIRKEYKTLGKWLKAWVCSILIWFLTLTCSYTATGRVIFTDLVRNLDNLPPRQLAPTLWTISPHFLDDKPPTTLWYNKVKKTQHCELWYNKIYQISYTPDFSSLDVSVDGFCYRLTSRWSWRTQNILDIRDSTEYSFKS